MLVCAFKLTQEAGVVLREHTQVLYLIFQVGDALDAHTEGVSAIHLAVDAAGFQHIRVYHTATQDFHPARAFAEGATFSSADVARDIHFRAWLREGEV